MSVGNGKEPSGDRVPEQVRSHTEATLKQVMATGDVARAMLRLLMADESGHRLARVQLGQRPEDALPRRAAEIARQVIDSSRQKHEMALDVYVLATYAGALASTASSDGAAAALIYLASLHERLGYVADALRLIETADTEDVSERGRRALAIARACTGSQQPHHQDSRGHQTEHRPETPNQEQGLPDADQ